MLHRRLLSNYQRFLPKFRTLSTTERRHLLSREFALNDKWTQRFEDLKRFQLGASYEWITSVQKKFIGDGKASAVDVEAAVCLANEEDQLEDIVELIYKLRHTENSADMLSSTEYAMYRLLLKFNDTQTLFKLINDPINYGVFMNEHCYCLAIDYFIKNDNIPGAAEVATNVMKQELFDNELLNILSVYSLLKWLELPADQRVFSNQGGKEEKTDEDEFGTDEDETTFKFPYLRQEFNDGHFDLEDPMQLVIKSLKWFIPHIKSSVKWKSDVESLVQKLQDHTGEEPFVCEGQLSEKMLDTLNSSLPDLESELTQHQSKLFDEWRDRRRTLIETQARSLNAQLRLEELAEEEKQAKEQIEILNFFDNRVMWESMAKEKEKLFKELNIGQGEDAQTEETYAKTMFEQARARYGDKRT